MGTIDVTSLVAGYRDTARALWNGRFVPLWKEDLPGFDGISEWDFRDRFEDICVDLFAALVLVPAGAHSLKIWPAYRADAVPLPELQIVPQGYAELLVAEPVGNSFRSYDSELTSARDVEIDLRFLAFFDYDVRGIRDLEYCHCVIAGCDRPQYVGRNVLVRSTNPQYRLSPP